jgi:hypothetical protein
MLMLLQARVQGILGDKLVGLYVTGSLVTGDFDEAVSDLDLVAVTAIALEPNELDRLRAMHQAIAHEEPRWDNRIEVIYLTAEALRTFRTRTSTIAVTSPGEPFHTKEAGKDWLINWYVVREKGVALFGPSPGRFIAPISKAELVQAVEASALAWRDWVSECRHRNAQVYAILTLCRALYTFKTGEYGSKRPAALWAEKEMPTWAPLIREALRAWREDWYKADVDQEATFMETVRFVNAVVDEIVG